MQNTNNTLETSNPKGLHQPLTNNFVDAAPEENALVAGDSLPACDCYPYVPRLLWHEQVLRTNNSGEIIGWLSLIYAADENGHGIPKLKVRFVDLLTTEEEQESGYWMHDITDTPLGQFVIRSWTTLYRGYYDALLHRYAEWLARAQKQMNDTMTPQSVEGGVV
jgi:hypothetical protein